MRWSSLIDPARVLPLAFALVAIYLFAGLGAKRAFADLAPATRFVSIR